MINETDMTIKYRMKTINLIFKLLMQSEKSDILRKDINKVISQKALFAYPKGNYLNKQLRKVSALIAVKKCCKIFSSSFFNQRFVNYKIRPIIKKIFLSASLEDLISYSNDIEKRLTLNYFFDKT